MILKKVISGGQTGADKAGLKAAKLFNIETGGWAPRGWKTAKGRDESLRTYGLREHQGGYKLRTHENVKDSDATIRIAYNFYSPGEICTLNAININRKPYFDIAIPFPHSSMLIKAAEFIIDNKVKVLNIAGNTESNSFLEKHHMSVEIACVLVLINLFSMINYLDKTSK